MRRHVISQLLLSKSSSSSLSRTTMPVSRNHRLFSTASNNNSNNVDEAEAVHVKPSSTTKLLVMGGNGFVGSHVCKEALTYGLNVSSLSRRGRASVPDSWADDVVWHQGDLMSTDSLKNAMKGVTSVISCVGSFGSNSYMYKINGTANINAIRVAVEQGVQRFVYISAADFGIIKYLLKGYYDGKRATETELMVKFPYGGEIFRPGFIYGTRQVGSISLPLGIIGAPLEMILKHTKTLSRIPLIGPLFTPPVHVTAVAKVAVRAATDQGFPPGVIDAYDILQHAENKSY